MSRLRAACLTIILAGVVAAVFSIMPRAAEAHSSLAPEMSIDLSSQAVDQEDAHCHGAIERVVTFFLEPLPDRTASETEADIPPVASNKYYRGWSLTRDPPVPIFLA